uniref:Putative Xaa-Pro aminopeptidase P n=1 Tax=Anthurium amnicola TaxID=1678845 RepID=A0A1D1XFI7_9ARAE
MAAAATATSSAPSPLFFLFSRSTPALSSTRGLRFLNLSASFLGKLGTRTLVASPGSRNSGRPTTAVRCSGGPITARPSSELRRNPSSGGNPDDEKLRALRELFSSPNLRIDAYIIPSQDAHQSEFIAECFMRRAFISGFTGSAGTAIVTKEKAALWTDGRYFLQAEKQLSKNWILMRSGNIGVPTTGEWLNDSLAPGCRIGIDPFLFSCDAAEELRNALSKKNHELVYIYDFNLVDKIWKESRPKPPMEPIRVHDIKYAGIDVSKKLSSLRADLHEAECTAIVISMLDEIAWLLNLRGNDIPHSPVVYAYLIVEVDSAKLFVDNFKVTQEVMIHLETSGVELRPYEAILPEIESLAARESKLWLDTSSVNAAIFSKFNTACDRHFANLGKKMKAKLDQEKLQVHENNDFSIWKPSGFYRASPITFAKAVKNEAELEGMCNSHLRDAAALAEFWAWLEEEIHKNVVTEIEVADRLLEFRSKQTGFIGTSFDTISASGANGAIIHYKPHPDSCSIVDGKTLFLLDSGGQYVDGTTDITRTVHFGEPTSWQKECFTRVLQGHIALDQAVFPERTPGFVLDALARVPLWKIGLDYRHGTGHGVGAALNVHEGPQSISFRFGNMTPLQKGMVISNEPGYYEDHSFGIRIENLLYIKEAETSNCFGGITYLSFEKLTFVPIQSKLVDLSLLSAAEVKWLNNYHSQVWEKVSPLLDGPALKWLWNNTKPISKE